jgi:membrane protein implicated in regulation of membrane protease activity
MDWWAWIVIGAVLLGSELAFVDAQFYLVFVGAAAFAVGLAQLAGLGAPAWLQWLIFAALAASSMLTFRRRIYERMRRTLPSVKAGPAGEIVTLPQTLSPGETCRLEFRGSSWWCTTKPRFPNALAHDRAAAKHRRVSWVCPSATRSL